MAGLAGMSDVTAMVRQHRDRMLVRIMVDALQKRVEGFRMAGKDPQRRSMQLVADAWALSQALPALDDHTLVCTRCVATNASLVESNWALSRALPALDYTLVCISKAMSNFVHAA